MKLNLTNLLSVLFCLLCCNVINTIFAIINLYLSITRFSYDRFYFYRTCIVKINVFS